MLTFGPMTGMRIFQIMEVNVVVVETAQTMHLKHYILEAIHFAQVQPGSMIVSLCGGIE